MAQFSFKGTVRGPSRALRRVIRQSTQALWAERLAVALWPAFSVVCLVAAGALMGAFEAVGPLTHRILLALSALAILAALGIGFRRFRRPAPEEAISRLDQRDPARPLATLADTLSVGSEEVTAKKIWVAHQRRAEEAAAKLTADAPDLRLAGRDIWALRLAAPALLITALAGTGDWSARLLGAAQPLPLSPVAAALPDREAVVEAWATPPAYTGAETLYLTASAETAYRLPAGTEITIRITDLDGEPTLEGAGLTGLGGFSALGEGLFEAVAELSSSGPVTVSGQGRVLARWEFDAIPDHEPQIEIDGRPRSTLSSALEFDFIASDDYGIVSAWAEIVPEGGITETGLVQEPINFALPLPINRDALSVEDTITESFVEHVWAGARVNMVLHAEDAAGQIGRSEPISFRLPERNWSNRLAASLVEQRRELALDFDRADRVLDVIQAVTRRPDEVFGDKLGAYMGTRMVVRRLSNAVVDDQVAAAAEDLTEVLWDIALTLEGEGDLDEALQRLRAAEQQLRDALENGTDEEIAEAIDQLREAMNEYLQELARQAMENPQAQQQQPQQQQPGQQMTQQDLEEMLNEMQRQAEAGLRDQARDMLSELSRMLENLQAGQPQMQQGQGQQALQELQEMIQRQRDLADRTFDEMRRERRGDQQGQQGQGQRGEQGQQQGQQQGEGRRGQSPGQSPGRGERPGGQGQGAQQPGQGGNLAEQQEALRQALEDLANQFPGGQGSQALDEAGRAMGSARDNLQSGDNPNAVEDQMDALDRLNEGAQALAEQMQNGQGDVGATGRGQNDGQGRELGETDPFDRQLGSEGSTMGRDTKVPDRSAVDRAREILEELRRRSAEPERPELELDYFERLLEQF